MKYFIYSSDGERLGTVTAKGYVKAMDKWKRKNDLTSTKGLMVLRKDDPKPKKKKKKESKQITEDKIITKKIGGKD